MTLYMDIDMDINMDIWKKSLRLHDRLTNKTVL